jgi:hypothetical protein
MTDIKDLIECLVAWANSSDMGRKPDLKSIPRQAASAIEALQAENERLQSALSQCRDAFPIPAKGSPLEQDWAAAMGEPESVPDFVKASVDAMGKGEAVAYRAWFDADNGARWLFTLWPEEERLDVEWEPLYAAPKALAPLTQEQVVEGFCNTPHQVQYVAVFDAGVRFAEAAHGIHAKGGQHEDA